jgi:putative ABC transport system ATP-binding protein
MRPRLLLADEPTGNLDAVTGGEVIDLMFELNAAAGTTLILVTHDENLARRCGRHVRLAAGRIVSG